MAKLQGPFGYTGSMGELSAYRMQGVDKIILRRKGGASREKIRRDPNFDLTRRNNQEWSGCTLMTKGILHALQPVRHLGDYNYTGDINSVCKKIQHTDSLGELGKRSLPLSQQPYLLEGFSLNRYTQLNALLRHPLPSTLNRDAGTATVQLPELVPGINLLNPQKLSMYRLVFSLGVVPDIAYDEDKRIYVPVSNTLPMTTAWYSDWHYTDEKTAAQDVLVSLNDWQVAEGLSLLLSGGIEFGIPQSASRIIYKKYSGAGKVLQVN